MADPAAQQDDDLGPTQYAKVAAPSDDDLGPPQQKAPPDTSVMKSYVNANISAYKVAQTKKDQTSTQANKTYADGFGDAFLAGLQGSSGGLIVHGMPTTVLPENAGRAVRVASQIGGLIGDLPAMFVGGIVGDVLGGGVNPITAGAGAFGLAPAIKKMFMDHLEKGDIQNKSDFVDRLMGTVWEGTKGAAVGAATAYTGGLANSVLGWGSQTAVDVATKSAAELAVMTTTGAALEGHLPNSDEFIDGALLLGGLHGVSHVATKLRNIYSSTGEKPADVVSKAAKDVGFKQDMLSTDPTTPPEAQPTDLKITPNLKSGTVNPETLGPTMVSPKGNPGINEEVPPIMKGFPERLSPVVKIVFRDENGEPKGVLSFIKSEDGGVETDPKKTNGNVVYVDPEYRRQGIATKLYDYAKSKGYDVDSIAGKFDTTPEGASFVNDRVGQDQSAIEPPKVTLVPKESPEELPPIENSKYTPEEQNILNKIGVSEKQKSKTFGQKFDDWYARNIDYLDPIKSALMEAKKGGAELVNNAYEMGRRFAAHLDTVRSVLEFGTRDGETGEINGEGLNTILRDIPKSGGTLDGFRAYGIAKRALELDARGITPYEDFNKEEAQTVVDGGSKKYEAINQRRVDFENRVLDFAQKKGLISAKALQNIKDLNANHFPLNRVQDADLYTGRVGGGSALKKIYGSELAILDPILQTYKNTEMLIKKSLINDVRASFVNSMRDGGLLDEGQSEEPNPHAYLTEVKKQMKPIEVSSDELSRGLEKQGFDGIDPDALTIFRPEETHLNDNQIKFMVDGNPKIYEGPPGVIDALKRMDGDSTSIDAWSKIMRGFANATRIGVIANPAFGFAHFFRSQTMAGVYSKTGMIPFYDSAMVLKELMGKSSEDYQNWVYHGGASSSWFKIEDDYLKDNAIEKNEKEAPTHGRAWNVAHNAMEATEAFIKLTDNASRFAEYKKSIASGLSPEESAFRSREVVPDYQKVGLQRSALRTGVAFIGAHINSLDRMQQAFQEDPKSTIAKLSAISAVSAMLWAANKDDPAIDALPDWQKFQYWNFNLSRLSGGQNGNEPATILRLPKPWAPGILFGSGAEVALDQFSKDKPREIEHFMKSLSGSVIPEPIPNIAQPILEQWRNKNNFTGRALVNEGLEKELPEMQYAPYTSEAAKQIAKLIGYVPFVKNIGPEGQNVTLQSPIVVDNYVRAWGGTVGGWALKTADVLINQQKKNAIDQSNMSTEEKTSALQKLNVDKADPWQNTPILHSFVSRYPGFNDQNVQDFYENKKEFDQVTSSIRAASKKGDILAAQRIADEHPDLNLRLDNISKSISTAKKTYSIIQDDGTMPAVEKRQVLDTILFQVGAMAKQGNKMISDFKKRGHGTMTQGE